MWGVDDEIRDEIKEVVSLLTDSKSDVNELIKKARAAVDRVNEMIFKEENILFPMALDTLNEDEWLKIAKESGELGYCIYEPKAQWKPKRVNIDEKEKYKGQEQASGGYINFETGLLTKEELEAMLNTMPVDVTFVDKDGIVKYFSQGAERIFPRPKTVIGRKVENCHPPASVHIVQKIVEDLKSGVKDYEDFWIKMKDKYIMIRYLAVRDKEGKFLGVLEFTQNIAPLKAIEGEKRLMSD